MNGQWKHGTTHRINRGGNYNTTEYSVAGRNNQYLNYATSANGVRTALYIK